MQTKKIIAISIALNLFFVCVFSFIVYKKGGANYLLKKYESLLFNDKKNPPLQQSNDLVLRHSPKYFHKKSLFELLPDNEKEIIFLGDSLIDRCEWSELFHNLIIKNRGISGDRTDGILLRIDEVVSSSPDKIFIMAGINDLSKGVNISDIVSNYEKIIKSILFNSPNTKIYVHSVLPISDKLYKQYKKGNATNENVNILNQYLKKLCSQYDLTFINLWPSFIDGKNQLNDVFTVDGIHLNGKAYLAWKSMIEKYVSD